MNNVHAIVCILIYKTSIYMVSCIVLYNVNNIIYHIHYTVYNIHYTMQLARIFADYGSSTWNSLPLSIRAIRETV